MKTRSKALYAYLLNSGTLHGTEEDIALAKREYRKQYKRQWKQKQNNRPLKEIRFNVTIRQLTAIKIKASELGIPHTTYARSVILANAESKRGIPNMEKLLQVLQILSMAAIASARNSTTVRQLSEQLNQAEHLLLQYLKM